MHGRSASAVGGLLLLHVRDFAVHERHLHVLVDVELLAAEIDFLVGLTQSRFYLIRSHSLFYACWFSRRRGGFCWRRLLLVAASLLLSALVSALLLITLRLLVIGADGKQLPNRIFHRACAGVGERPGGKLERDVGFVVSRRIGLVASVASHDAHRDRILADIHVNLGRINFVAHFEELRAGLVAGGVRLVRALMRQSAKLLSEVGSLARSRRLRGGRMDRSVLKCRGRPDRTLVRKARNSALLNAQQRALVDNG